MRICPFHRLQATAAVKVGVGGEHSPFESELPFLLLQLLQCGELLCSEFVEDGLIILCRLLHNVYPLLDG